MIWFLNPLLLNVLILYVLKKHKFSFNESFWRTQIRHKKWNCICTFYKRSFGDCKYKCNNLQQQKTPNNKTTFQMPFATGINLDPFLKWFIYVHLFPTPNANHYIINFKKWHWQRQSKHGHTQGRYMEECLV